MAESKFPYFLLGLGIGAAAGILLAPKSGDQLRAELRSEAEGRRERIRQRALELRRQAEEAVEKGKGTVQSQRDHLAAALEAGRRAYRQTATQPDQPQQPEPPPSQPEPAPGG